MTTPRRRWSFSLRTLFVATLLCACGLMTLECVHSHQREKAAQAEIETLKQIYASTTYSLHNRNRELGRVLGFLQQQGLDKQYQTIADSYRQQDEAEDKARKAD
jgi:hypothetical protein